MHFQLRKVLSCTPKVLFNSEKYFPGALQKYFPNQKSTFLGFFRIRKVLLWAPQVFCGSVNYFPKQFLTRTSSYLHTISTFKLWKVLSWGAAKVLSDYWETHLLRHFPTQKSTFVGPKSTFWLSKVLNHAFPTRESTFLHTKSTFKLWKELSWGAVAVVAKISSLQEGDSWSAAGGRTLVRQQGRRWSNVLNVPQKYKVQTGQNPDNGSKSPWPLWQPHGCTGRAFAPLAPNTVELLALPQIQSS